MYASNVCLKPQVSAWFHAIETQISPPRCGTKTFRFKQSCQRLRIQMKLSDTKHLVQKVSEYLKIPCIPANMLKSPQWPSLKDLRGTWDDELDTVHLDTMVYLLVHEKHVIPILRVYHVAHFYPSTSFTVPSSRNIQASPPVPARPLFHIVLISRGCRLPFRLWRLYLAARHGLQHMLQEVPVGPLHALELRPPQNHKNCWSGKNKTCVWSMLILLFEVPYHTTSYHQKGLNTQFRNQTCQGKFPSSTIFSIVIAYSKVSVPKGVPPNCTLQQNDGKSP